MVNPKRFKKKKALARFIQLESDSVFKAHGTFLTYFKGSIYIPCNLKKKKLQIFLFS